jgi:hypothetical protein
VVFFAQFFVDFLDEFKFVVLSVNLNKLQIHFLPVVYIKSTFNNFLQTLLGSKLTFHVHISNPNVELVGFI